MTSPKKSLTLAAVAALIATAGVNLQPRPAHAVFGLASGNATLIICGIAGLVLSSAAADPSAAGTFGLLGIVLLNDSGRTGLKFAPLSLSDAATLGLSETERAAFNGNLDEINTIAESIEADLSQKKSSSPQLAHARWVEYSAELDSAAVRAAEKVSARWAQELN